MFIYKEIYLKVLILLKIKVHRKYIKLLFPSNLFKQLLGLLFFGTAATDDKFPNQENDGCKNENEKGEDVKEKVFVPGQLHCMTFHPGVVRVSKQVFKPPHRPEIPSQM